ncbi:ABC transporter ATP-binding protein [Rhizobium leguminosarum]|uniref:ABC transporter ATP-binding protein n=1 Tax=Rhizobium leguminosarum TaxID=384 RepID=UPI0013F1660D|nr:ABC transporter ATP-binding protein [Rhizobium leguminosarum]MBY5494235.1 ABC transporter ATP-binding protein [Rhizobium leguminosarum]UIK01753.1 ABC transporter ATP-binding protein [Rhizobium leguminosarum]UIK14642.1 ABC transporter ATP-binding protein [Rhizobium leguminosarum]UIL31556.1 ABC transporter ATP-binding protein [Rhizobium leguminosarum]
MQNTLPKMPGTGEARARVEVKSVSKSFSTKEGTTQALRMIDLVARDQEFTCIVGPSGCGKSTLFNIIAGLLEPTSGRVLVDGVPVEAGIAGRMGYMQQKDLLIPWRTIVQNVTVGLEIQRRPIAEARETALSYLKLFGLEKYRDSYPASLSGGMRQRVALMRTLAMGQDIILMDEPFQSLDYPTRIALEADLLEMVRELKRTVLFITHDIEEAVSIADKVYVLSKGPGTVRDLRTIRLNMKRESPIDARKNPDFHMHYAAIWNQLEVVTDLKKEHAK